MTVAAPAPPREDTTTPCEESEDCPPERSRSDVLNRNLAASIGDGAGYGVMVGAGETYLGAFVLAIGMSQVMSGLITSIPILAGGLMQMISPRAVRFLGSYRRWCAFCVFVQAASFLPLIFAAVHGSMPEWLALAAVSVYWGSGMGAGPAWNTWIGTLVPKRLRPRYFARRTRVSQLAVFIGFVAAGVSLQFATKSNTVLPVFACVFTGAAACRFLSSLFLSRQTEHRFVPIAPRTEGIFAQCRRLYRGKEGRLLTYIIAMQCAVQISGPYFSPYMFKQLQMSYAEFVCLISTSFLAKIAFLPMCGRFAQRFGPRRLLQVGGVGLIPLAALWLVSDSLPWLIFNQLLAGAAWAAYELAFFLMFFDSIPEEERTGVLTLYNFANSAALVVGSLLGGWVLKMLGPSHASYCLLFAMSSLGRAMTLPLLRRIPEVGAVPAPVPVPMGLRPDAIRTQAVDALQPNAVTPETRLPVTVSLPAVATHPAAAQSGMTPTPRTVALLAAEAASRLEVAAEELARRAAQLASTTTHSALSGVHRLDPPRPEVPEPETRVATTVLSESVA